MRQYRAKILVFTFLGMITAGSALVVSPYEDCGPELLADPGFKQNDVCWRVNHSGGGRVEITEGVVALYSTDAGKSVRVAQTVHPHPENRLKVRLSARVRCRDVVAGQKRWNRARVTLGQHDGNSTRWDLPHGLTSLEGTEKWRKYAKVFTIAPATKKLILTIQLSHATGSLWVKDLSLRPVCANPIFHRIQKPFLVAWGLFLLWVISGWLRDGKRLFFKSLLAVATAAVLIGTMMPGDMKAHLQWQIEGRVTGSASRPVETTDPGYAVWVDRISDAVLTSAHFIVFGIFAFFLAVLVTHRGIGLIFLDLLIFAGTTELVQFYIDGRTPMPRDFLLDIAGGTLGILLGIAFRGRGTRDEG